MADVTNNYTSLQTFLGDQKKQGGDLYAHMTKVMSTLVTNVPPHEALNKLEEVSYLTKKGSTHCE